MVTVNYYDTYIPAIANLGYDASKPEYNTQHSSAKGLLTCTRNKYLGETGLSGDTYTFYYYDAKGNLIQQRSNNHLGGYDAIYYKYNYNNLVTKKLIEHTSSAISGKLSETYTYTYDALLRLSDVSYTVSGGGASFSNQKVTYAYDDIGRLVSKTYPYTGTNEANAKLDYSYNLRGWLTKIDNDLLTEDLFYTTMPGTYYNDMKSYNGNISAVRWKTYSKAEEYGYYFLYNAQNFLTQAVYCTGNKLSGKRNRYNELISYDLSGNVKFLSRNAEINNTSVIIDHLTFTYQPNSNKIKTITENISNQNSSSVMEFKKGTVTSTQYSYWPDGKLQRDFNRDICRIDYNYLALPSLVLFRYGHRIEYTYDAAGSKLRTKHLQSLSNMNLGYYYNDPKPTLSNPIITTTDYVQNKVYVNGTLQQIITEHGYVDLSGSAKKSMSYLKDHQGNNRIVIDQTGAIVHETAYYPSGSDNLGPSGRLVVTETPNRKTYDPGNVSSDLYTMISNLTKNSNTKHYIYHTGTNSLIYYDLLTSENKKTQNERGRNMGVMNSASQMRRKIVGRK